MPVVQEAEGYTLTLSKRSDSGYKWVTFDPRVGKFQLRMTIEEISALEQYLDTLHFLQDASVDQRVSDLSPDVDSAQTAEAVGHLLS